MITRRSRSSELELSRDGVCKRYGWSREELDEMIAFNGFPAGELKGEPTSVLMFRRTDIAEWEGKIRRVSAFLKGALQR